MSKAFDLTKKINELLDNAKRFYIQQNVGTAKYVVNYYDGVKKHKDGSDFYDVAIFSNKKKLDDFIKELKKKGYTEK
jgi:hypothetical protein